MANPQHLENNVRDRRTLRGWSQEQLAARAGLSRAGISAIETGRLIPSAAAALSLAAALECRVEDLFRLGGTLAREPSWAWSPRREPCRYWKAEVGGSIKLYPAEGTVSGVIPHDGVYLAGSSRGEVEADPEHTLVMACCDPAAGLLAAELARAAGVRLIALPRSSRTALSLLGQGLLHVAGVHLTTAGQPGGNAGIIGRELGPGYTLLRAARWEEGITFAPGLSLSSVRGAVGSHLRWVGREEGSGARQCLDELFGDRRPPRRLASDHRGVAEAVRSGWADAGVCLRLVSEEAGLNFLAVREETYDLCFPDRWEGDHRIQALLRVARSASYRRALGELPGYDSAETGELHRVR
ncbi:MAG TPA: substrate-binding domain-containing protein [Isosphaeraceae bacterium]|nr:substrate-binding domain-containing protein [Isosphaeraceae bacterium]